MTDDPTAEQHRNQAEREELRVARRLMASAEKSEIIKAWLERRQAMREARGGELVLPDHTADVAEIQARLRARALAILEDIALHSVSEKHQLRACELVLGMPLTAQQPGAVHAHVLGEQPVPHVSIADDQVSKVHEALVMRRKLAAGGVV